MKKYIVIIMTCAFLIMNEFEDVAAQNDYENFVERFEFLYWVPTVLYFFFLNSVVMTMSIAVCTRIFVQSCQAFFSPQNLIASPMDCHLNVLGRFEFSMILGAMPSVGFNHFHQGHPWR